MPAKIRTKSALDQSETNISAELDKTIGGKITRRFL